MESKITFKNSRGLILYGILSNPTGIKEKPVIILAHGHSSNKKTKSFTLLNQLLQEKGFSTFRFDFSGHGESEGKFEDTTVSVAANDIISAIQYLKSQGYTKIGLVGSSFGGIASIIAASKSKDLFVLVLKSPVSNYADLIFWRGISTEDWKRKGYRDYSTKKGMLKLNYSFYEDAQILNGYVAGKKITVPTLIVHGNSDQDVPVEQSIALAKVIYESKLHIIEGADHTYTNPNHMK